MKKIGFIPPELLSICMPVVEQFHQKQGLSNLAAKIAADDNIAALTSIPDASAVLNDTNRQYDIRKWCFLASIGIVCLSFLVPWWSLLTLVVIFLADRFLAYREKGGWKFLSAVLLSLEMLTNDFAGWGKAYPEARAEAVGILKDNPESPKSTWLDYYLPQRAGGDPSLSKVFEPSMLSETAQDS
jgi:hypothetical protein